MAFENIDTISLKNALISCKDSINHSISDNLINNISNSNIWESDSKNNLKKALNTLTQERFTELEKEIDKFLSAIPSIEEYKDLQKENEILSKRYSSLVNSNDPSKKIELNNIKNKISSNNSRMDILKSRITNVI